MLQIRGNDRIPVLILKAQHILVIQVEASWKNQVWTGYRLKTMTVLSHVAMAPLSALLSKAGSPCCSQVCSRALPVDVNPICLIVFWLGEMSQSFGRSADGASLCMRIRIDARVGQGSRSFFTLMSPARMVAISPCMKAQGTLEPTSGHFSPLGQ